MTYTEIPQSAIDEMERIKPEVQSLIEDDGYSHGQSVMAVHGRYKDTGEELVIRTQALVREVEGSKVFLPLPFVIPTDVHVYGDESTKASVDADLTEEALIGAARAAHEANRAWCITTGDTSQASWDDADDWQRSSAIEGVRGVLNGNTPQQSHESWLAHKEQDGWVYGETKNSAEKTHPCMVPYEELSEDQRVKDDIFVATVTAFAKAARIINP
jgi:hypothetical protein